MPAHVGSTVALIKMGGSENDTRWFFLNFMQKIRSKRRGKRGGGWDNDVDFT